MALTTTSRNGHIVLFEMGLAEIFDVLNELVLCSG